MISRFTFLLLVTLSFNGLSQDFTLKKSGNWLLLKDKSGQVSDSLYTGSKSHSKIYLPYQIEADTITLYRFFKFRLPDNCPDFHISQLKFTYKTGTFILTEKKYITFYNTSCASLFHEDNVYCIYLTKIKLNKKDLQIWIEDTEDRKTLIKTNLDIFTNEQALLLLRDKINSFLKRKECFEMHLEVKEDYEEEDE